VPRAGLDDRIPEAGTAPSSDHFLEPEVVDEMVCAELPDPSWGQAGELAEVVWSAMIHGPCGEQNSDAPCMEGRECTKRYPRPFCEETTVAEDGYPLTSTSRSAVQSR
jgi:hypothetical protein